MSNSSDDKLRPYLDKYEGVTAAIEKLPVSQRRKALIAFGLTTDTCIALIASAIGPIGTIATFLVWNFALLIFINQPDTDGEITKSPP